MAAPSSSKPVIAGYIRVSSRQQRDESESPANQRLRLEKAGASVIYEDLAVSGYRKAQRKKALSWERLWLAIANGEIQRLIACRMDRYARRDSLVLELAEHCEANNCSFETLTNGAVDLNNPSSWISVKVESMLAEYYSRQLSHNIKSAQAAAIERKVVAFTSQHLGWHLRRIEGTKHGVEPHPDRWDDARAAVLKYIDGGWSMEDMSAWIYDRHQVMKTGGSLIKWLHSHNIRGDYGRRNGPVWIADAFPALINREESVQLEHRLKANAAKRGSHRAPHFTYALSGVTQCKYCGSNLAYSCIPGRNGKRYVYLKCNSRKTNCKAGGRRISEWKLEESMLLALERATVDGCSALEKPLSKPNVNSRELSEAKRRLRKLEILLEEGEDADLRAAFERQVNKVAQLQGTDRIEPLDGLRAIMSKWVGHASWYEQKSAGERNGVWLTALKAAPVDLLVDTSGPITHPIPEGADWRVKLCQPEFKL